ncbi:MAG: hypothetical protein Q8O07_04335 [Chloroflexota bacterium]|nr:hypothetical protein [Chloroflexota bacterium]
MKKKKIIGIWALVVIALLVPACSLPPVQELVLAKEVKAWLQKSVDRVLVKCGDSHFDYICQTW